MKASDPGGTKTKHQSADYWNVLFQYIVNVVLQILMEGLGVEGGI